jgi:hypothetical protein
MAKFYGPVGYVETVETAPGVWREQITERHHYGDVIRNIRRSQSADKLTDDVVIDNEISIVVDPYAMNNLQRIRYVEFMGAKWEVSNVNIRYPRLILTLGGVYNGK